MTKLLDAMRTEDSVTNNGMKTNSSTLNHCVDLFSMIGAARGIEKQRKINNFIKAFNEDKLTAMKIAFWLRDVRGGAGERQSGIDIMTYMADNHTEVMRKNLHLIPEYGRWSDVLPLLDTKLVNDTLVLITKGLEGGDKLCAKWLPRGNGKGVNNKRWGKLIRNHLKLEPKSYRKLLANMSDTVEQLMCSGEFESINYSHVPSKAMSDYMKVFGRRDYDRFSKFLDSVTKGESKINSGAVYPYDIIKNMRNGSTNGADIQWGALPNYMEDNVEKVLPLVDVSASMDCPAGKSNGRHGEYITCMDIAISLGLYISERNEGVFKDSFLTFSAQPKLEILKGTLSERYKQMSKSEWGYNTNIEAAFEKILDSAVKNNVPPNEMPTMLLILSDMEFDRCEKGWESNVKAWDKSALEMITDKFEKAGYVIPKLTFWNINSINDDNKPAQQNDKGVVLISGFSVAILKTLLSGVFTPELTPYEMMMEVINDDRYSAVTV